jgi:hypothetical protein
MSSVFLQKVAKFAKGYALSAPGKIILDIPFFKRGSWKLITNPSGIFINFI